MADKNSPNKHGKNIKYHSETGNVALARNKCEGMLLNRNLDFYDKQSAKAIKSMKFARQQFLKTLSSKEKIVQCFGDDKRRQSSPVVLAFATRNASITKGACLMHETGPDLTQREKPSNKFNRLYQHRHSHPTDGHDRLRNFQSRKEASLTCQTEDSTSNSFKTRPRSWNDLKRLSDYESKDFRSSKLHSSSLPKLHDLTNGRKDKKTPSSAQLSAIDKKQPHQQPACLFLSSEENQDQRTVSCEWLPSISKGKHCSLVLPDSYLSSSSCPNLRNVAKVNNPSEANEMRIESSSTTECRQQLFSGQEGLYNENVSDTLPIILVSRPDSQMTLIPFDKDV